MPKLAGHLALANTRMPILARSLSSPVYFAIIHHTDSHGLTQSHAYFFVVSNKPITFYDRLDGTVSENIYFKFVVNVMWEPVPGSTLMKLCSLAPPFETVPSGAKRRVRTQFQRVSWLPYYMKVKTWFL